MPLEEAVLWLCDILPHYGISVAKLADTFSKRLVRLNEERKDYSKCLSVRLWLEIKGLYILVVLTRLVGPLAGPVVASV